MILNRMLFFCLMGIMVSGPALAEDVNSCLDVVFNGIIREINESADKNHMKRDSYIAANGGYLGIANESKKICYKYFKRNADYIPSRSDCHKEKTFFRKADSQDDQLWKNCKTEMCNFVSARLQNSLKPSSLRRSCMGLLQTDNVQ